MCESILFVEHRNEAKSSQSMKQCTKGTRKKANHLIWNEPWGASFWHIIFSCCWMLVWCFPRFVWLFLFFLSFYKKESSWILLVELLKTYVRNHKFPFQIEKKETFFGFDLSRWFELLSQWKRKTWILNDEPNACMCCPWRENLIHLSNIVKKNWQQHQHRQQSHFTVIQWKQCINGFKLNWHSQLVDIELVFKPKFSYYLTTRW